MPWVDLQKKREYDKKYRETHKKEIQAYQTEYYRQRPEKLKEKQKARTGKLRGEVIAAYGGRCQCPGGCEESEPIFLTIDHIFDDGAKHREEMLGKSRGRTRDSGTARLHRWLKKNGFPKDRFRLLCYNCNCGRARNGGVCPHQQSMENKE